MTQSELPCSQAVWTWSGFPTPLCFLFPIWKTKGKSQGLLVLLRMKGHHPSKALGAVLTHRHSWVHVSSLLSVTWGKSALKNQCEMVQNRMRGEKTELLQQPREKERRTELPSSGDRWSGGERHVLWGHQTWNQSLVSPLTSCVALGKLILLASICSSVKWGAAWSLTKLLWTSKWDHLYKAPSLSFYIQETLKGSWPPFPSRSKMSKQGIQIEGLSPSSRHLFWSTFMSFPDQYTPAGKLCLLLSLRAGRPRPRISSGRYWLADFSCSENKMWLVTPQFFHVVKIKCGW